MTLFLTEFFPDYSPPCNPTPDDDANINKIEVYYNQHAHLSKYNNTKNKWLHYTLLRYISDVPHFGSAIFRRYYQ